MTKTDRRGSIVLCVLVAIAAVIAFFPLYWMVMSSFRTNARIFSSRINLLPGKMILDNYRDLFTLTNFPWWFSNSLFITIAVTVSGLFLCSIAGFALAKYKFRLKTAVLVVILIMVSIPRFVTVIPVFKFMSDLGLTDTFLSLILPFAINPLAVFLMKQYIEGIPDDLLDSARIDGLNELQIVLRIIMPVIKPALGAGGILLVMQSWNSYLFPLVMMSTDTHMVLTVGLASLKSLYVVEYGMIMAGSALSILPLSLGYLLFQKQFIAGLTAGAVKG